jgi:hypothetical protein
MTSLSDPQRQQPPIDPPGDPEAVTGAPLATASTAPAAELAEIKSRANINEVWAALGGPELRGSRGIAFWRNGDSYNVSLDVEKGLWFDFRDNVGGDVITLVQPVRKCSFADALEWLARFTGMSVPEPVHRNSKADADDWRADLEWSEHWARAARIIAEDCLAALSSWSLYRGPLTDFLRVIGLGEASRVAEYRRWRQHSPQLTTALARAGQRADARLQRRLALWLRRYGDGKPTA